VIGIHAIGGSPNLLSTVMDFCRGHRCDAHGLYTHSGSGCDPDGVINEVRIAARLVR
jgi:hypothetical protein